MKGGREKTEEEQRKGRGGKDKIILKNEGRGERQEVDEGGRGKGR